MQNLLIRIIASVAVIGLIVAGFRLDKPWFAIAAVLVVIVAVAFLD